ncbi:MAG TPA: sugar transferase [Acidimicrobiia bacterium]|nr:sugar transferase [Acidimicrobiia bacterium]
MTTDRAVLCSVAGLCWWARALKRGIDVIAALVLLLVTLPLLVAAVVAIRLTSPGPALFRQRRLGTRGRPFTLYKLRTMALDTCDAVHQAYVADLIGGRAQPINGVFKLGRDQRVTLVGALLRRYSIDELPQLWNVLRGDMSLVGPRPPLPREAALYDARMWERLQVKPGLTGLWQVSGRCKLSFDEMVELDLRYARSWSVWLEIKILMRTPLAVMSGTGAR